MTKKIKLLAQSNLPTKYGNFIIRVYTGEIVVLIRGKLVGREPILVRVQSECLTGEVFNSLKCECGAQLALAMKKIAKKRRGIIIYLRQEGRGIGIVNKIRAYQIQDKNNLDTVEANLRLGFKTDQRDYSAAAKILMNLGVKSIVLLTNNPRKVSGLQKYGIRVNQRMPIEIKPSKVTRNYLYTKKKKLGHFLEKV